MKYSIIVTETAKSCLKKIISDLFDISQDVNLAYNYADRILDHCETLGEFPHAGCIPDDNELRSHGFRFLIYGDYLVFYDTDDSAGRVYIQAIVNGKKDYAAYMRGFLLHGVKHTDFDK